MFDSNSFKCFSKDKTALQTQETGLEKDQACPMPQSALSLLQENSAAFHLLQLRTISSHPHPSSQGDQQSPFISSADICIFEAEAGPAPEAAQEAARVHANFEVCRDISRDVNPGSPCPTCSDRQDSSQQQRHKVSYHTLNINLATSGGPGVLGR